MTSVLDTCAFIWAANDPARLSTTALAALRDPDRALVASAVTITELHRLVRRGAVDFVQPGDVLAWVAFAALRLGVSLQDITPAIAHAAELLAPIHKDPADRLILATAQQLGADVVTPDGLIAQYPGARTLW